MNLTTCVSALCLALAWGAAPALGQVDDTSGASSSDDSELSPEPVVEPVTVEPAVEVVLEGPMEVEGAEHLSSAGATRGDEADSERPVYSSSSERRRRLIFVAEGRESLLHRLTLQLPDWQVRQVSVRPTYLRIWRAQAQLMPGDVVVWIEQGDDVARVALLDDLGDAPRSSSLPAVGDDDEEWSRAFALVVEGLIREQAAANQQAGVPTRRESSSREDRRHYLDLHVYGDPVQAPQRRRRSWMRTPVARDGWLFRFGWTQGFAPRRRTLRGGGSSSDITVTGGLRVAAGRWLHRNVRVGVTGEFAWGDGEPEGALGLQAMVLSSTRLRIGGGVEVTGLIVGESDVATGNRYGWVGYRFGLPLEIGLEVNRKGGIFVHLGPTFTKAPYSTSFQLGYQLSMEWEFN